MVLFRKELFKFSQPIFLSLREILIDSRLMWRIYDSLPEYKQSCLLGFENSFLFENLFKTKAPSKQSCNRREVAPNGEVQDIVREETAESTSL